MLLSVNVTSAGPHGEASFTLVPHSAKPFVVQTQNALVQVLGTSFTVRQYPGEHTSQVVVEEGRVAVRRVHDRDDPPTVLSARMMAQVRDSGVAIQSSIALRDYTSWKDGTLVFNRMVLRDVVAELGRAYGADIRIADSTLANQPLILEVSVTQQPLTQVLDFVSMAMHLQYRRAGNAYILSAGRGASRDTSRPQRDQQHQHLIPSEKQYGR